MQATTARPRITVTTDGQGVASHAGTRLLGDLADAVGMSAAFSDALAGCGGVVRVPRQDSWQRSIVDLDPKESDHAPFTRGPRR